ncbi:unnamed protein product [Dovyalis caffra]|uniref:AT-hook motif nuclear-localized protein n=1 Tax=Dovyalis caffra TaxID=77055 RepID=A0AAV1RWB8_9ROSI|nr:unnamed protein product [Dovyalis caffra]
MEPNEPHQQQQHHFTSYFSTTPTPTTTITTTTPSPTNGLLPPHHPTDSNTSAGPHMLYPHSMVPSTTATVTGGGAPMEATGAKRKRGRPRKYGTPELALAAKKTASSAAASREKKEHQAGSSSTTSSFSGSASKKSQHASLALVFDGVNVKISNSCMLYEACMCFYSIFKNVIVNSKIDENVEFIDLEYDANWLIGIGNTFSFAGNAGHGFTPHVITVAAGEVWKLSSLGIYYYYQQQIPEEICLEHGCVPLAVDAYDDVTQKIMHFLQQSTREMCILSASGSISNASLRQPATSGGNIAYEGRFEIISMCGSYVRTEMGGKAGGLSVCLSDTNGQIIGGGVGGPLKAAGPVQVIVGTFLLDNKKDGSGKGDASGSKLPSPVGASGPSFGFRSPVESSLRNPGRGNDDHPTIGVNPFTMQSTSIHFASTRPMDWRSGPEVRSTAGYDFTGHGGPQSPENGDYE